VKPYCSKVIGIELQQSYVDSLNASNISCVDNLSAVEDNSLDIVVSFHVIEHLPSPLETLEELKTKIVSGGQILIEVPHARDFLLSSVDCDQFKQFTLWSQHLVLHTRESLMKTLEFVGLVDIQIEGIQRYPLSNHLHWLANGMPGGHKSKLSLLDSDELHESYRNSLARIDATDTLVALARVP
jgi:SAM-dependent methyltransferase